MYRAPIIVALAALAGAIPLRAQQTHHPEQHADRQRERAGPDAPYAGLEGREIKALGADEVESLLDGAGAGYALAAELNHYPGPGHVLELAPELGLTPEQAAELEAIVTEMRTRARALGRGLVEAERRLDRAFRDGAITPERLRELTAASARIEAELRFVHLEAHLATRAVLSPDQVARYDELRGYRAAEP